MLSNILTLIAGFGVFLFGMNTFSSNLEKISGNKMRKKINQFSKNRFAAASSGFVFTTVLQSSKAGIIMIAGFASAGMISLFQGLGLTLGSSIASAIPNFLIAFTSFNIKEFFYALSGVGVLMFLFSKKNIIKNIATVLIGFSLLFIGMGMMGTATSGFSSSPAFIDFFQSLTNPFLLILIGILFTMVTQTSLATIAILMTLVGTASLAGAMPVETAAYIIFGANIGTSLTTFILVSISSNIDGKRICVFHLMYITLGVIIFSLLSMLPWIKVMFSWVAEPAIKLAFINLTFNLVSSLIALPLLTPYSRLVRKILPGKSGKKNPLEITEVANEAPSVSLAKANEKVLLFYDEIISLYKKSIDYIKSDNNAKYKGLLKKLSEYNSLINKLNMYVVRIANQDAYENVNREIEILLNTIKQIERMNRNCIKLLAVMKSEDKKITYSNKLLKFVDSMTQSTEEMFEITRKFIVDPDCKSLKENTNIYYERVLALSQQNSKTKLLSKTFIIESGTVSRLSIEKKTSYIELMSYLGIVSNNILDIVFTIVGQAKRADPKYEQLILDGFVPENKE